MAIISIPIIPELEDVEIHNEFGVFFSSFDALYMPLITPIMASFFSIALSSTIQVSARLAFSLDNLVSPNFPHNNWELSVLRATSVLAIIRDQPGVDPAILTASGRSEYHPVDPNDKSRNRRIEVILAPKLDALFDLLDE